MSTIINLLTFSKYNISFLYIGLLAGDVKQAHHLIPWEFTDHAVIQTAAKGANPFHMNELFNGIALDKSIHVEDTWRRNWDQGFNVIFSLNIRCRVQDVGRATTIGGRKLNFMRI